MKNSAIPECAAYVVLALAAFVHAAPVPVTSKPVSIHEAPKPSPPPVSTSSTAHSPSTVQPTSSRPAIVPTASAPVTTSASQTPKSPSKGPLGLLAKSSTIARSSPVSSVTSQAVTRNVGGQTQGQQQAAITQASANALSYPTAHQSASAVTPGSIHSPSLTQNLGHQTVGSTAPLPPVVTSSPIDIGHPTTVAHSSTSPIARSAPVSIPGSGPSVHEELRSATGGRKETDSMPFLSSHPANQSVIESAGIAASKGRPLPSSLGKDVKLAQNTPLRLQTQIPSPSTSPPKVEGGASGQGDRSPSPSPTHSQEDPESPPHPGVFTFEEHHAAPTQQKDKQAPPPSTSPPHDGSMFGRSRATESSSRAQEKQPVARSLSPVQSLAGREIGQPLPALPSSLPTFAGPKVYPNTPPRTQPDAPKILKTPTERFGTMPVDAPLPGTSTSPKTGPAKIIGEIDKSKLPEGTDGPPGEKLKITRPHNALEDVSEPGVKIAAPEAQLAKAEGGQKEYGVYGMVTNQQTLARHEGDTAEAERLAEKKRLMQTEHSHLDPQDPRQVKALGTQIKEGREIMAQGGNARDALAENPDLHPSQAVQQTHWGLPKVTPEDEPIRGLQPPDAGSG